MQYIDVAHNTIKHSGCRIQWKGGLMALKATNPWRWVCLAVVLFSQVVLGQCPDKPLFDTGDFTINQKIRIVGDGNGDATTSNNQPLKVCAGEWLTLYDNNQSAVTQQFSINQLNSIPPTGTPAVNGSLRIQAPTTAGLYNLMSLGSTAGTGGYYGCQVIEVVAVQAPVVSIQTCTPNQVKFIWENAPNNEPFDAYTLLFAASDASESFVRNEKTSHYPYENVFYLSSKNYKVTIEGFTATGGCSSSTIKNLDLTQPFVAPHITNLEGYPTQQLSLLVQNGINQAHGVFMRSATTPSYGQYPERIYSSLGNDAVTIDLPQDAQYCFRLGVMNTCDASKLDPILWSDNEICSTPMRVSQQANGILVQWSKAPSNLVQNPFVSYEIIRINPDATTQVLARFTDINQTTYTDQSTLVCGKEYSYQVITYYQEKSSAAIQKLSTNMPPPPIQQLVVEVKSNTRVSISANFASDIQGLQWQLFRSTDANGTFVPLNLPPSASSSNSITWLDDAVQTPQHQYCYYLTWQNTCQQQQQTSAQACTIWASIQGKQLQWTAQSPFAGAAVDAYTLYEVAPSSYVLGSAVANPTSNTQDLSVLNVTNNQTPYYVVQARQRAWGVTSISNEVAYPQKAQILLAKAFTPNGDAHNNTFYVQGRFIQSFRMWIYDRWGNLVAVVQNPNYTANPTFGWDGTNQGKVVAPGAYSYRVEVLDDTGNTLVQEGSVTVLY